MQVYAIKLFNFCRFGEKNNSVVFDLSDEQKRLLQTQSITFDQIYDEVMKDPVKHIKDVKERGIERYVGILGATDGDFDMSNGVGKSSIMESMCYANYDKVVRKLVNTDKNGDAGLDVVTKINNKIPEYVRESYVEELFEENDKIYRIKRGRSFTKTHKGSTPFVEFDCIYDGGVESESGHRGSDTSKNIDEVNMMDYDLFTSSQMFAQSDSGKFLIGTDKIKKEMIIKMLKLEGIVKECLDEIRNRKNTQDKKLQNIRTNVEILEKSFLKSCVKWMSEDDKQKFSNLYDKSLIDIVTSSIDINISTKQKEIDKYNVDVKNIEEKISELEKTNEISLLKSIQEEGTQVRKEKEDKEKQLENQTKDLNKNIADNMVIVNDKINNKKNVNDKVENFQKSKIEVKSFIETFDMAKCTDYLLKVEKAKKVKPEYDKIIIEVETRKTLSNNEIAILNSQIKNKESEIKDLKIQIDGKSDVSSGDMFLCKYCKSDVSRQHILDEINKNTEDIVKLNNEKDEKSKVLSDIVKELQDHKDKLNKIVECINNESRVVLKINDFNSKKVRLKELDESISDYISQIANLDKDITKIEENTASLKTRKEDIQKTFDQDLKLLNVKLNELRERYDKARNEAKEIETKITNYNAEKQNLLRWKSDLDKDIGSISNEKVNLMKQDADIKEKSLSIPQESKQLERYTIVEDVYGLDGIQTRVIKKYLPLLNSYVQTYMEILSEGNITVNLDINSRSELVFEITGNAASSFVMMSGGEKMLVHLAVDIGLALLAFSRLSKKPEMICLDEVFGPLDNSHTEAVFKVLNKLSDTFSRIVIISHKDEIKRVIKNNIVIEKSSGMNGLSEIKFLGEFK